MTDSSNPLTAPDCDLRDFPFMPMDIVRLFGSRFHAISSDGEWRAGVTLWLKSFHQVPAASLPDDDIELCRLAELGRDVKEWKRLRANALHGWVLCADGRWYHPVVAEKANEAWNRKQAQRARSAKGNAARWGDRNPRRDEHETRDGVQEERGMGDRAGLEASPKESLKDSKKESNKDSMKESLKDSPKDPKGQGQGEGQGEYSVTTDVVTAGDAGKSAAAMTKDELWKAGKSLLSDAGMPASQCGSFVGKLVKDYGDAIVVDAVRSTVVARPADPAEYLKAVCMRAKGDRKTPNRQEAIEQRNSSVADQWTQGAPHETV